MRCKIVLVCVAAMCLVMEIHSYRIGMHFFFSLFFQLKIQLLFMFISVIFILCIGCDTIKRLFVMMAA